MQPNTENAIRSIVSMDETVSKDMLEKAMGILKGIPEEDEEDPQVIRFSTVMKYLGIKRRTLSYYLQQGYLTRVYGGGRRALGISRDSYLRFTRKRMQEHRRAEKI